MNGLKVEGFATAVNMLQSFSFDIPAENIQNIVIDADLKDNRTNFSGFDPAKNKILSSDDLVAGRLSFDLETSKVIAGHRLDLSRRN